MSARLSQCFDDALAFTARLHATQTRKGTDIPYISHLLAVSGLVITHGGDEDEAIAGLLHDAVEDQGGQPTLDLIRTRFGERVAVIIDGCTDTDVQPKPPWQERKERYLHHLKAASLSVKLVAAADKLDNVRAILADHRTEGSSIWSRFTTGNKADQQWFYRGCVTALAGGPQSLVQELDVAVSTIT
jgi:(p)ppGpp synthase/HD superfamily hydrolase